MIAEKEAKMEKSMKEEEIKELEDEIDSAVDRLFIEKEGRPGEKLLEEPPSLMPSYEMEKGFDLESSLDLPPASNLTAPSIPAPASTPLHAPTPSAIPAAAPARTPPSQISVPVPQVKSTEKMEAQILALEWEITEEKLGKAKDEVRVFRELVEENAPAVSILDLMDKVLDDMMAAKEDIHPSMIHFLLDSKEAIKLFMRKDADKEISIYKELASRGLEARFSCLGRPKRDAQAKPASLSNGAEVRVGAMPRMEWEKFEEVLNKLNSFSDRMAGMLDKIDRGLSNLLEKKELSKEVLETKLLPLDITIFEASGELFGVESDKVCKLFKVPKTFDDKYLNLRNIRLRDFEVRMIDLGRISLAQTKNQKGEKRILVVRDDGEYKGLIVQQVIKRLSVPSEPSRERGEHFLGVIHWTYQEHRVDVRILDLSTL